MLCFDDQCFVFIWPTGWLKDIPRTSDYMLPCYTSDKNNEMVEKPLFNFHRHMNKSSIYKGCSRGRNHMTIGFTTTYAISVYHHWSGKFKSCSSRAVLDTTLCDKVYQCITAGRWFSPGTPVSSNNKTYRYYIAEILLKVALKTITLYICKGKDKLLMNLVCTRFNLAKSQRGMLT